MTYVIYTPYAKLMKDRVKHIVYVITIIMEMVYIANMLVIIKTKRKKISILVLRLKI